MHLLRPRPLLVLAVALGGLLAAAPPALADHTMPDVVGFRADDAVRALEALGANVRVVTVAGVPAGQVSWQDPAPGQPLETGGEAELHVGVRVIIDTLVPNVVGRREEQVVEALDQVYFLVTQYVRGAPHMDGRVSAQVPAAGASLPYRGEFRLQVVRNAVEVPFVVGLPEAEARAKIEEAGLLASVSYLRSDAAVRGTVISQLPREGATTLPGGVVELQVAGRGRPGSGHGRARVPDLSGLGMHEAEGLVFSLGLTPHVHVERAPGQPDWTVVSQEVPPGRALRLGADVGFTVAKPGAMPARLRTPYLYGLGESDALELLTHLGLTASVTRVVSGLPAGTVFGQTPTPGTLAAAGLTMQVRVAQAPPRGWRPSAVLVPDVTRMDAGRARMTLLASGLGWIQRRGTGSAFEVDRVYRQSPEAGQRVRPGTDVTFYLPLRATVPDLAGKTRLQALEALQAAGLQGLATRVGPDTAGISEVVWQQYPAGKVLARGSLVRFRYKQVAPPSPLTAVPDVVGRTKEQARAMLEGAGFRATLRALSIGLGTTEVVSQTPAAGALRPAGFPVVASYRYVSLPVPLVRVPRVIGMERDGARRTLQGQGFGVTLVRQGPTLLLGGSTEVIAQNPMAGSLVARGTTITVTWRYKLVPAPSPTRVRVPSVVGMRVDRAVDRLRSAGLNVTVSGVGTRVRSQSPVAGSLVLRGTSVRIKLRL